MPRCNTSTVSSRSTRQRSRPTRIARDSALYGLPVSFKDNINVSGMPTTAGTPGLADYVPQVDAGIVQRFKHLGARVVGKNNMHELSFGVTSANHTYGAVLNPANQRHSAGGSSGGCAAAVAAGLVACAVGTDTGGSVRIPAAFCGIVGVSSDHRPLSGRRHRPGVANQRHSGLADPHRGGLSVRSRATDRQRCIRQKPGRCALAFPSGFSGPTSLTTCNALAARPSIPWPIAV